MYQNKSLKIVLIILCSLVAAVFIACYFIYADIKTKNENYQVVLRDLSFQNQKQEYLAIKFKSIDDMGLDIGMVDNSMVSKDAEVKFIESLEALASEYGLTLDIDSLIYENNQKIASSSLDILRVKTRTKGTWAGSYMFLSRLEAIPIKVKINNFSLLKVSDVVVIPLIGKKQGTPIGVWQGAFEISVLKYK